MPPGADPDAYGRLPRASGAEQDRYGKHFSKPDAPWNPPVNPEHDVDGSRLPADRDVYGKLPRASGAEQDRYGKHFSKPDAPWNPPVNPERDVDGSRWSSGPDVSSRLPRVSGAEQDRYGKHFSKPDAPWRPPVNPTGVGLLQSAILPSFGFHAGLSTLAYGVSRYTRRVDGKDWLWALGMTANAWWSAIGTRVINDGLSVSRAWSTLGYTEKLLLGGVSAWGLRLFYRVATRSLRSGQDDPRYHAAKKDPDFWNKAFFSMFLPEAVAQTLISLPFTLPFRDPLRSAEASPVVSNASLWHGLAVFLFSTGFALEVVADAQLEEHKRNSPGTVNREGAWSIVRHPNYLGDALIHASFPALLLGAGLFHPIMLAGPVVNYIFLRYIGGDRENEASQEERYAKENPLKSAEFDEYKKQKNSFWPSAAEVQNKWTWLMVGAGVAGAVAERAFRSITSA
jgi:steroid 5-alpha reductase family enzyme